MRQTWEDNIKTRLTDRAQLLYAVEKLMKHGIPEDMIPGKLARAFYVDMDELNVVLQQIISQTDDPPDDEEEYQAVA